MFGCLMSLKSYKTVVSAGVSLMNQIGAAQLGSIRTAVNTQRICCVSLGLTYPGIREKKIKIWR